MRKDGTFDRRHRTGWYLSCKKDTVCKVFPFRRVPMPSVGTRRSTRVFVPKTSAKISEFPVKLRSGKRVLLESDGSSRSVTGDEWIRLLRSSSDDVSETESEGLMSTPKRKKKHLSSLKNDASTLEDVRLVVCRREGILAMFRRLEDGGGPEFVLSSGSCQKIHDLDVERDDGGNLCTDRDAERELNNFEKFRITYSRKRQRSGASDNEGFGIQPEKRMYGLSFTRKQRGQICRNSKPISPLKPKLEIPRNYLREMALFAGEFSSDLGELEREVGPSVSGFWQNNSPGPILACMVVPSSCNSLYFANFLVSVLNFIGKPGFDVYRFVSLLLLELVGAVFSQHGIHFPPLLQSVELRLVGAKSECKQGMKNSSWPCVDAVGWRTMMLLVSHKSISGEYLRGLKGHTVCMREPGICAIFGNHNSVPILSFNFAALPTFFMLLHSSSVLFASLCLYMPHLDFNLAQDSVDIEDTGCSMPESLGVNRDDRKYSITPIVPHYQRQMSSAHPITAVKRTPLKDPLNVLMNENNHQSRSSVSLRSNFDNIKGFKILVEGLNKNVDILSCKANILMVHTDRCWREPGAHILLKESESKEWMIAVEHHDSVRFLHKPQEMKFCTSNRYTHAMMWSGQKGEMGWKLEFCDRRNWVIFKELYKECCRRNVLPIPSTVNLIPIPGVQEVVDYESTYCTTFSRPPEYITDVDDELGRALVNDSVVYDMDPEDEEYLKKLNRDRASEVEPNNFSGVVEDVFEKSIDRFEKIAFRQPDNVSDFNMFVGQCCNLLENDIIEHIYHYWLSKRNRKGKALVGLFQRPSLKRAKLIDKPFLRKERSFKRRASYPFCFKRSGSYCQGGRGIPETFLQEVSNEVSQRRVEQAQEVAKQTLKTAILKRRKAQSLMQDADLAAEKALMAVRIAAAMEAWENLDIPL